MPNYSRNVLYNQSVQIRTQSQITHSFDYVADISLTSEHYFFYFTVLWLIEENGSVVLKHVLLWGFACMFACGIIYLVPQSPIVPVSWTLGLKAWSHLSPVSLARILQCGIVSCTAAHGCSTGSNTMMDHWISMIAARSMIKLSLPPNAQKIVCGVVKNPFSNAGDAGFIPDWGTKIPHAPGQLSPPATREPHLPQLLNPCALETVPQLESPCSQIFFKSLGYLVPHRCPHQLSTQ